MVITKIILLVSLRHDVRKQTVNHYVQRGSHVFCAFIDFNKAFDNVDYWLLFCDLINNASDKSIYLATRCLLVRTAIKK